jgi:hypothetical protein
MPMIKLVSVRAADGYSLNLAFSDGSGGRWSADDLLARDTVLTRPLMDLDYFRRAFIEGGALAWPNGLELSPARLHQRMAEAGALTQAAA